MNFITPVRLYCDWVEFKEMHGHCNEHEICSGDFEMAKDDQVT